MKKFAPGPSLAALKPEALLQREAAVKKLAEEVLNPANAVEVRIRPEAE